MACFKFQETAKLRSKFQEIIESKADSVRHLEEEYSKLEEDCVKKTEENNNLLAQVHQLTEVEFRSHILICYSHFV